VLDPVSSLEKSKKSMQRGELLPRIPKMETPEERFLGVIRWILSGLPKERFGKKPYNPILGETFRCCFKHKDPENGVTYLVCEQVSHHPPITATHLNNPSVGWEVNSVSKPEPRFYGNYVEIKLNGISRLYLHDLDEEYHLTRPTVFQSGLLGIGTKRVELMGLSYVVCEKNNLVATIDFKGKSFFGMTGVQHSISGSIRKLDSDEVIYEVEGVWDTVVKITHMKTGQRTTLYSREESAEDAMHVWLPPESDLEGTNSLSVWKKCSDAIWKKDSKLANEEKKAVEDAQRALRKVREENKTEWKPQLFVNLGEDAYFLKEEILKQIPKARSRESSQLQTSSPIRDLQNPSGKDPKTGEGLQSVTKRVSKLLKVSK